MERMPVVGNPGHVGRFRPEQIAQQNTWVRVPEAKRTAMALHIIHVVPSNGSTETQVNPTDPGDEYYLIVPTDADKVHPAGRMRY